MAFDVPDKVRINCNFQVSQILSEILSEYLVVYSNKFYIRLGKYLLGTENGENAFNLIIDRFQRGPRSISKLGNGKLEDFPAKFNKMVCPYQLERIRRL